MSDGVVGTGSVLSGRYRLLGPVGTGGMGTVWRALDELLDREVAVKEVALPPGPDDEARATARRRTVREAQSAARLRHPAIVTVYDVVEHDDRPWIVMELVPSRSLAEVVKEDGPLPPARVAAIGLRILDAMVTADAGGVRHRDIKPANVLIAENHRVVLTDFGIARHLGDEAVTATGMLVGSPDFLAPERARGQDVPGLAGDLWSLGATMYDAVEGRRPFARNSAIATLAAVVMEEPPPALRAGALRPVIEGLLAKDPEERLDADQTRAMLQRVIRGLPASAPAAGSPSADSPSADPAPTTPLPTTPAPATPAPADAAPADAAPADPVPADSVPADPTPADAAPAGPVPAAPPRDRRRLLAGAAVLLVLAVAAVVVPLTLAGDDDPESPPAAAPSTSRPAATQPASTAAPTTTTPSTTAARTTAAPAATTTPPAPTAAPTAASTGFTRYTDPTVGFSVLVPTGWAVERNGSQVDFEDPDSGRFLRIDSTSTPQADPYQNWVDYERTYRVGKTGYQNLGIRRVSYGADRGWTAADWEFRLGTTHVLNRNVRVGDDRAHAIYWSSPESQWNSADSRQVLAQAQASFTP